MKIRGLFDEIPRTYERINHLLTFGLDGLWRVKAAKTAASLGGNRWLDACCGTGQMTALLRKFGGDSVEIFATDFSAEMMNVARTKKANKATEFVVSDVRNLPFADETFDLITVSLATRNLNRDRRYLVGAFREFHRVLRRGGHFVNLETSQPKSRPVKFFFHLYVALAVARIGGRISGSEIAYRYLSQTIPRFYEPEQLAAILRESGFTSIRFHRMTLGSAAVHIARKS